MIADDTPQFALDQGCLGFHLSFMEYAKISADAGFTHVEAPLAPLSKQIPAHQLRSAINELGLSIGVFTLPWNGPINGAVSDQIWLDRCKELPKLFAYAKAAGADRVSAFFNDQACDMLPLSEDRMKVRLSDIDLIALDEGITFCAELNTKKLLKAGTAYVVKKAGTSSAIRLLVDFFHLHRFDLGSAWIQALPLDSIGWVHIADAFNKTAKDPQNRAIPGDGCLNIPLLLSAIKSVGYEGPLSTEVLSPDVQSKDPAETAKTLWRALSQSLSPEHRDGTIPNVGVSG